MAPRTLSDDSGNIYPYVDIDEWPADGTSFAADAEGRPLIGPSGPRVDPEDLHPDHVQHVAAARRLGIKAHEYTGQRCAGLLWCWYGKHWVKKKDYSTHPLSKICKRCGRAYEREKSARRRARKRIALVKPGSGSP